MAKKASCSPASHWKCQKAQGFLGAGRKNQLFTILLPVWEAALAQEPTPPWREQASLGAISTQIPTSPFLLCASAGVGKVPTFASSSSPHLCKGLLLWSLLMQPRWFCLHITRHSAGLDACVGGGLHLRCCPISFCLSCTFLREGSNTSPGEGLGQYVDVSLMVHSTDIYRVTARPWGYDRHSPYPMESGGCGGGGGKGDEIRTPPEGRSQMPPGQPGPELVSRESRSQAPRKNVRKTEGSWGRKEPDVFREWQGCGQARSRPHWKGTEVPSSQQRPDDQQQACQTHGPCTT